MKIYVVTQGEYSAYHIVGVTLDRQKAERWVELYNDSAGKYDDDAQVEEYESDSFGANGLYLWQVDSEFGEINCRVFYGCGPEWNYTMSDGDFRVTVMAKDRDHAIKAAYDKVAMLRAEREGIT